MDTTTSIKMTTLAIQNLFSYVEEENLAALKAHLDKFKEVDGRSDNGQTPLMLASEQGSIEIVQELIRRGANVNLDDVDCWSALICAAKEGHVEVVKELLESSAYIEHRDMGGWTALMWAAYKGRVEVTKVLLDNGANPNTTGQQYSVYPIIWAAGRGHAEIVQVLLENGAKVNCSDKYGTTPLIWAARKGHFDCVMHLLENGADVDQEGANSMTALIVAVKGGFPEVVKELLKRNPNVNMTDKDGNTALMIAAKEGYTEIVQDLLDAGTYVNIPDRDNKTALYWAVEKGNATMVRDILQCNPDTETCTKDLESPLIKATKMRNIDIVELLLDKGAKRGDTPLHIAIRGRSRRLAELLLRHLSPTESDGDMLGYDLYSSALADILSEPTMQPPICVGLYAQWGSGKSFLLKKLEDEMKTFAGQQVEPLFQFSWLVVFMSLLLCGSVALVLGFTVDPKLAIAVSLSLLALLYWWCTSAVVVRVRTGTGLGFLFTDYNRLSSVGGETSLAEMIATLSDACEREFGFMATRLFRVFKTEESQGKKKWKKTCCIPSFVIFVFILGCLITGMALLAVFKVDGANQTVNAVLIAMASAVGLALVLNCRTWWQVADSVLNSQRKRLHSAANKMHKLKSEGFMKVLKNEVELMARMAKTIDGFTQNQTRPFLSIFASRPPLIIKAINQKPEQLAQGTQHINGMDNEKHRHCPSSSTAGGLSSARKENRKRCWHEELDRKLSQHSIGEMTKFGSKTTLNRRITFNWDRLASWINLTETWPYRTSWLILFLEETDGIPDQAALKTIYERISKNIPTTKDVEPLLEIDGDVRSFEVFLSSRTPVLNARDIKTFLPCTVNLDPKLREIIADVRAAREQMSIRAGTYPSLPLQEAAPRPTSVYSQQSGMSACPPSTSFNGPFNPPGLLSPPPHSSNYSGMAGPQHPFYNRGSASVVSGTPAILLSSMNTDAVCERVKQIEGIDQSMLTQYTATIKKANVNGRVLTQCNIDELKNEMKMNFGDWQLFRGTAPTHRTPSMSSLNSQESSNDIVKLTEKQQSEYRNAYQEYIAQMATLEVGGGGGEKPVQPHPNQFMTSSSSEDKTKDKATTKRSTTKPPAVDAPDFTTAEAPLDPITEEDEKQDPHGSSKTLLGRKVPGSSDRGSGMFQGAADLKMKTGGLRYQKLTSDDEDSENSDAPLLGDVKKPGDLKASSGSSSLALAKGKEYPSDSMLDKKDSSDSGMRSNESSPNHSLQDEEADLSQLERANLIELDQEDSQSRAASKRGLPSSLSGLQDPAVARMSICSEDQCSLLASSPEESWPSSKSYNLNRTPSNTTLNNNTNAHQQGNQQQRSQGQRAPVGSTSTTCSTPTSSSISEVIISTGSGTTSTTTKPGPHNENVRVVHLKRGLNPGDPPEITTVSSDTVTFGEERESIL
ncbi:unnamed protein product [Coregonus sp. 'balchen']|nr:unnamed protein product [Coregonus sp. 'balchen']